MSALSTNPAPPTSREVLIVGATGYIGGRLLPRLEAEGYTVRCLSRNADRLRKRVSGATRIFEGDVLEPASLKEALSGVDIAFYFVHSMGSTSNFEDADREAAKNFIEAASHAGVRRVIYLGGLGYRDSKLSKHLRSR